MAEVTLVIDNSTGILDIDYNEVAITRRMYRSGESEYLINNHQCRLRDIRELIMDTGIGAVSYTHLDVYKRQNCIMSGLIGYRSGNRGRCVGSCRKPYELIDRTTGNSLGKSYILSTKDLNTIDYIDDLKEIDSLKIEEMCIRDRKPKRYLSGGQKNWMLLSMTCSSFPMK